ncbi:MAG TPA: biotin-dependent carboxyltransferase family protein [Gemmatimonadales bacterium]|nr:biotin-dependent carboxyltransferase family protein [Gemmatimonadales bacterium]
MIRVLVAPPFATIQDQGRTGYRAAAVPPSGAMDPVALEVGNALLDNPAGAAAIECALGGCELRFERREMIALTGASVEARIGGRPAPGWTALVAEAGEVLRVARPTSGAWYYVCIGGGIAVPPVLGSRSTCLPAHFGGLDGRPIRKGDVLPCGSESMAAPNVDRAALAALRPPTGEPIGVVPGPARAQLRAGEWERFLTSEFRLSASISRMGYRLEGPSLGLDAPADLPSAPACPGAVQLPPGGTPIVLFNDGPTVGGYPIIAVVASAHLGLLAQHQPGSALRFRELTAQQARALVTEERRMLAALRGRG